MDSLVPDLEKVVKFLCLDLSRFQKQQLLQYVGLLLEGSKKQRLVGERDGAALIKKQLCDALYPVRLMRFPPGRLLDLGTGGGLPGIPLKICFPEIQLYLLDANRRKINFLRRVSDELSLTHIRYLPGRAERWGHHPTKREKFNIVVSRAVAGAAVLAELALPLVKVGGIVLMYKGKHGRAEIDEAGISIDLCGGRLEQSWYYRLPTGEERTLFRIKKDKQTPPAYPRRPGKPAQKPLGT